MKNTQATRDYTATRMLRDCMLSTHRPATTLPHVYCGRCRKACKPFPVICKNDRSRSRVVFACVLPRCTRKGIIQHRTPSYANSTGY